MDTVRILATWYQGDTFLVVRAGKVATGSFKGCSTPTMRIYKRHGKIIIELTLICGTYSGVVERDAKTYELCRVSN